MIAPAWRCLLSLTRPGHPFGGGRATLSIAPRRFSGCHHVRAQLAKCAPLRVAVKLSPKCHTDSRKFSITRARLTLSSQWI